MRFFSLSILLSLIITSCSEPPPLKLGFLGSMTGGGSGLCIAARDGAELAVETLNKQGGIDGRQVKLIVFDDQNDESKAREGVHFLADSGAVAIIGPLTSQMSVAATPTANTRKIPLISPTTSTTELSGLDDHFFRVYPTCEQNARALADHAANVSKNQRIAIIADLANSSFTTPWQHCFKSRFMESGGDIIATVSFNSLSKDTSFLELATTILEKKPDGILVLTSSMDAALFCQQVSKLSHGVDLYGSDWAFSGDLVQYGGRSVEGFTFTTNLDMTNETPEFQKFKADFTQRFDAPPKFPAVLAYEAAQVLFNALRRNPDPTTLGETLKKTGSMHGLQSTFKLDAYGDIERPSYINQVQKGSFVRLDSKG